MQHIGFTINGSEYTVPILKVQEIMKVPQITQIPQAPPSIQGVTSLRGKIIPIVSLKRMMGLAADAAEGNVIVLSSGRMSFGILVDGITGVITIDDASVEKAEDVINAQVGQVEGIAKVGDRLLAMLDPKKLIPLDDMRAFEDEIIEVKEIAGDTVEVVKKVGGIAGDMYVKEVVDAKEYLQRKGINEDDPRYQLLNDIAGFMDALVNQDYDKADAAIQNMLVKGQGDLFNELGKLTRKLHDTMKNFSSTLDLKLKDAAVSEMPAAVDRLQLVIGKTEEAANTTLEIVEKYVNMMSEFNRNLGELQGPEAALQFMKDFRKNIELDMATVLIAQSFQDITGQTLRKVIALVRDVEGELVKLLTSFGIKVEGDAASAAKGSEAVSQGEVDSLLNTLGF